MCPCHLNLMGKSNNKRNSLSLNDIAITIPYESPTTSLANVIFGSPIKISLELALKKKGPIASLSFVYDLSFKSRDGAFRVGEIFQ